MAARIEVHHGRFQNDFLPPVSNRGVDSTATKIAAFIATVFASVASFFLLPAEFAILFTGALTILFITWCTASEEDPWYKSCFDALPDIISMSAGYLASEASRERPAIIADPVVVVRPEHQAHVRVGGGHFHQRAEPLRPPPLLNIPADDFWPMPAPRFDAPVPPQQHVPVGHGHVQFDDPPVAPFRPLLPRAPVGHRN